MTVSHDQVLEATERLESLIASLVNLTSVPDSIHVEALREALPSVAADLRTALGE